MKRINYKIILKVFWDEINKIQKNWRGVASPPFNRKIDVFEAHHYLCSLVEGEGTLSSPGKNQKMHVSPN